MKNIIIILLFSILVSTIGFGQKGSNTTRQNISDKELNLELTKILLEIPEIRTILTTNSYNNTEAIFVLCDPRFFDKEQFISAFSVTIYLWHMETLFFNNINRWMIPISIKKSENSITYTFKTGSISSEKAHHGLVKFTKENNTWSIKSFKIK